VPRCGTDLRRANLAAAELRGVQLGNADLRGANLENADLRDADVSSARFDASTVWRNARMDGCTGCPP